MPQYQVSPILAHLMARIGPPVRRAAQRDAAHRASRGTRPEGQAAPPEAAIFCPPASLRAACGALHHGATRAWPADKILAVKWANIGEIWYRHIQGRATRAWANLAKSERTGRGSPPDRVAKGLKWRALRRLPRLARGEPRLASIATTSEYTP